MRRRGYDQKIVMGLNGHIISLKTSSLMEKRVQM